MCCTGAGTVNITVTPAGDSYYYYAENSNSDGLVSADAPYSSFPMPSENLISDSITIVQEGEDFSQKLRKESNSPTWAKPSYVRAINTWTNTQTARTGQEVVIYANIANRGDIEGPYTATLTINGVVEEVKTGMLQGNTAIPLEFVVSRNEPGTYKVDVNGQKTHFTVVGDASSKGTSSKETAITVALVIFAALIVALVVLIIRRRQLTYS